MSLVTRTIKNNETGAEYVVTGTLVDTNNVEYVTFHNGRRAIKVRVDRIKVPDDPHNYKNGYTLLPDAA